MKNLLNKITEKDGITFNPSKEKDLELLKKFNLPESITDFYKEFEPKMPDDIDVCMDIHIRLHPIKSIEAECEELEPSCYLKNYGYIAFAATEFGNPFFFDLNKMTDGNPRIVSADHELSYMDEISESDAHKNVVHVADKLEEFLIKIVNQEL